MMNVTEWETAFKPLINHLDDNASWQDGEGNGIMFETYGDEYEFVNKHKESRQVWSYRDDEYEGLILVSGMAHNPIGYFVTEVPWTDEDLNTIIYVEEKDETV
jgi:hypothetical protein